MPQVVESLEVGNSGWCRWHAATLDSPVFVRFQDADGRLVIVDLFLAAEGHPLDANMLRRIPLGAIEQWVNADETFALVVRGHLLFPGPDLRTAVSYFATTFGTDEPDHWVVHMFASQFDAWDGPVPDQQSLQAPHQAMKRAPLNPDEFRLEVPGARPFGDDFYRAVAQAYRAASLAGVRGPAGQIADVNHVHLTQVHRWVKVARDRGFLDRGRIGKA